MPPRKEFEFPTREHRIWHSKGTRLLEIGVAMARNIRVRGRKPTGLFVTVVLGLYAKAVKTFRAILLLGKHGFGEDAIALQRCLVEILANIKYLDKKDSGNLAEQYWGFTDLQDHKMVQATERNPELQGMFPEHARLLIQQTIGSIKAQMAKHEFEKRYRDNAWHGRRIDEVMREVGLGSLYDVPFRLGSRSIHATNLMDDLDEGAAGEPFTLKFLPSESWVLQSLATSSYVFLDILETVNTIGNYGEGEKIRSIKQEIALWEHAANSRGPT